MATLDDRCDRGRRNGLRGRRSLHSRCRGRSGGADGDRRLVLLDGLSGVLPTCLEVGDNAAEWLEEFGEEQAAVVELVPPEAKPELISALKRLSIVSSGVASPAIAGMAYEELIVGMLSLSLEAIDAGRSAEESFTLSRAGLYGEGPFDALIKRRKDVILAIEMKGYSSPLSANIVQQLIGKAHSWSGRGVTHRGLLVTRTPLTVGATRALNATQGLVSVVEGITTDDLARLTTAVRRAVDRAGGL